jgi:D-beta-D-heptose 7-phosphate kinase/D-beta-D-heptose 1-phosphate adenosyltransferase
VIAAPEILEQSFARRRDLVELLRKFSAVKALVVGDAIVDQYHHGRIDRISPEAPVPVFVEDETRTERRRGGADNVAHQLEALGCEVSSHFARLRSVKHRYMVGHYQVFRCDRDSFEAGVPVPLPPRHFADVVVLSDYSKGFLSFPMCRNLIDAANELKIPVVVDPKGRNWDKYRGATVICPNSQELSDAVGASFTPILEKRGSQGLRVWRGGDYEDIPATARHVYDVTGAGDTVVALVAAALGAGGSLMDGARLGVEAASYVVGEVGTTVCPKEKLRALLLQ